MSSNIRKFWPTKANIISAEKRHKPSETDAIMSSNLPEIPICPAPDPDTRPPSFEVPEEACDTHLHVFGPEHTYPYKLPRDYTPPDASIEAMYKMHQILGIERAVLTQPSVYGTDNRAILHAVATNMHSLRAVVAVQNQVTDQELLKLHNSNVRGIRLNLVDKGGMPFNSIDDIYKFSERIIDLGWNIEFLMKVDEILDFGKKFANFPVNFVIGHLGYMKTDRGIDHPGFRQLLALLGEGKCWVKLTGSYRISQRNGPPYSDVIPYAKALIETAPDRMLWGSDWPHPHHYKIMPNDGYILDQLNNWTSDPQTIKKILVDNPAELYGF